MDPQFISSEIKRKISESGCLHSGFAKAELLKQEFDFFLSWLKNGNHAQKAYLEREPIKRADPTLLVAGAKSVISILFSYYFPDDLGEKHYYKISKYGYGKDYHTVVKEKLKEIVTFIKTLTQSENTFAYVDTAPVFEKAWARQSGTGWTGKNTLHINKQLGSFVFIGTIITDVELAYDNTGEEGCGSCNRCLDACPTGALIAPYTIDVRKCISHLTMEQRNALPSELKMKFKNYIYGCDICQNCCPYNKNLKGTDNTAFHPTDAFKEMSKSDWENLTEEQFKQLFKDSAVERITYPVLMRNINFIRESADT